MKIKNKKIGLPFLSMPILLSLMLLSLSACTSTSNYNPSAAETAAAARSVDELNSGSSSSYTSPAASRSTLNSAPTSSYSKPQSSIFKSKASVNNTLVTSNRLTAGDVLDVNVFKVPDLSAKDLRVESSGRISLPLVGSVPVAGLTITQAEQKITQRLTKFMQSPQVSISRTNKAVEKRVTVEGEVKTPGVFPIKGNLSFLQAIALAQGLSNSGDSTNVYFYRDGQRNIINLDQVRKGVIADPQLRGDDRIVVIRGEKRVTVEGEVRTPGVFPITDRLTFLQAIALAQGLSDVGNSQKVFFYRNGQRHLVNLDLVRNGTIADPQLLGDDRIVVMKDLGKQREKKLLQYIPVLTSPFSLFK